LKEFAMISGLFIIALAAATVFAAEDLQSVQSKNDEFVFSKYPPRALAAGEQGAVRFQAEVNEQGLVLSCKITQSSGHWRLDRETCELIVNHATFKPALDSEGRAHAAVHDGIVNWRIPGRTQSEAAIKLVTSKESEKLICKRSPKTGSLVVHSRLCLSARDWERYADQYQEDWGSLQGRKGHTNGSMPTWSISTN
jgi:TonB family protein